ncbi:50S ribosomal protein L11 [Candidatus Kaiserbacteria bacterium CG10_big_fil_rev_8_21_14_0_10_45_20]|uniref:Large ribosomal subunit protein uL11 n=1 Tax=Candidatus Kaiserbacteria bacterium CG10_big_fil_rev_8_21_14_0_10_45_20 TaxID=1974607 RepID=A0A2H0UF90_9BACT|nr:MAG: 50S ribosomal protein L11 [Candidatus Kaiserbacteria bacterium CG10_big_fil_rev_8_21_14_0_10_45_20]
MAGKLVKKIKLQIPGGGATPAPPIGTVLGPAGINIGDFVKQFNDKTQEMRGDIIPVELSVYEDRSFDFIMKVSPASRLLLKVAGLQKGSGKVPSVKAGKITKAQLREIAEKKMPDLNTDNVEQAEKIIAGTARSMGIDVM